MLIEIVFFLPVALLLSFLLFQLCIPKPMFLVFTQALVLYPAVSPFFMEILSASSITTHNPWLNTNDRYYDAICLYLALSLSVLIGYLLPKIYKVGIPSYPVPYLNVNLSWVLAAFSLVVLAFFVEGGTIFSPYLELQKTRFSHASLSNQLFNSIFCLVVYSFLANQRKAWAYFYIISVLLIALIISRRTMAVGLIFILIVVYGGRVSGFHKCLGALLVLILVMVGEVRGDGVLMFLQSPEFFFEKDHLSLPGGSSQLFMGTLGVMDFVGSHESIGYPFLGWFFGEYESGIYKQYYDYNGGMHIVNILFWNFGWFGVFFGGVLIGQLCKTVDRMSKPITFYTIALILLWSNFMWYHPIGLIKLTIALLLFNIFGNFISNKLVRVA